MSQIETMKQTNHSNENLKVQFSLNERKRENEKAERMKKERDRKKDLLVL